MAEAFMVRLAHEEIIYLVRALELPGLPGLRAQAFDTLDQDHQALTMAVVDRTLQARGIVHRGSLRERSLNSAITGMLRACAQPQFSLLVDMLVPPRHDACAISFASTAAVVRSYAAPGVHLFLALHRAVDVASQLDAILPVALDAPPGVGEPGRIINHTLRALLQAAFSKDTPVQAIPASTSMPGATAAGLNDVLHHTTLLQLLSLWQGVPDAAQDMPRSMLAVAQGRAGTYLLWQRDLALDAIEVVPTSPAQALQARRDLLQPALASLSA